MMKAAWITGVGIELHYLLLGNVSIEGNFSYNAN